MFLFVVPVSAGKKSRPLLKLSVLVAITPRPANSNVVRPFSVATTEAIYDSGL